MFNHWITNDTYLFLILFIYIFYAIYDVITESKWFTIDIAVLKCRAKSYIIVYLCIFSSFSTLVSLAKLSLIKTGMVAKMLQKEFLCNIKIYFYSIKTNLYSKRNIFVIYAFFHPIKTFFYYMNFSFDTFLVTISGLPFLFVKVRISLSVYKSAMF